MLSLYVQVNFQRAYILTLKLYRQGNSNIITYTTAQ